MKSDELFGTEYVSESKTAAEDDHSVTKHRDQLAEQGKNLRSPRSSSSTVKMFDQEYEHGTQTLGDQNSEKSSINEPVIDVQKYGTGKPRRVVLKGKLVE